MACCRAPSFVYEYWCLNYFICIHKYGINIYCTKAAYDSDDEDDTGT